jgi:hypothetical protein
MARGLAQGRIVPRSVLLPISFRSGADKLVVTPQGCLAGASALATGTPASHGRPTTERHHVLQGGDKRFHLKFVRRKAALQPDAIRVLVQDWYPTPNFVSHAFQSMLDRLRRAWRPERIVCL